MNELEFCIDTLEPVEGDPIRADRVRKKYNAQELWDEGGTNQIIMKAMLQNYPDGIPIEELEIESSSHLYALRCAANIMLSCPHTCSPEIQQLIIYGKMGV